MILAPCNGIHTFFMRFAIDVVFVDRQGRVLKVCRGLKPGGSASAFGRLRPWSSRHRRSGQSAVAKGDQLVFAVK